MNKIIKAFVVVFAVTLSFISNSCSELDTIPINIPFSITVVTQVVIILRLHLLDIA